MGGNVTKIVILGIWVAPQGYKGAKRLPFRLRGLDNAEVPATQIVTDGLFIGLELVSLDGVGLEIMGNQAPPSADSNLRIAA